MFPVPDYFVIPVIFILGLILGSFLDVFVTRFHTGASINGRSRCLSCGHTLTWYELFPLLSYLFLKGKCLQCHARIPVRLFIMELFTALCFVFVYMNVATLYELIFTLVLISLLIAVALYDIKHMIIPNDFVLAICALAVVQVFVVTKIYTHLDILALDITGGVLASAFFGALWLVSKGRWIGLGDVKLAFPLAVMLGIHGVFSFVVLSFWVGALLSICLVLVQKLLRGGKTHLPFLDVPLTMKSEVPFAPFMIIAFAIVLLTGLDVFKLMAFGM